MMGLDRVRVFLAGVESTMIISSIIYVRGKGGKI